MKKEVILIVGNYFKEMAKKKRIDEMLYKINKEGVVKELGFISVDDLIKKIQKDKKYFYRLTSDDVVYSSLFIKENSDGEKIDIGKLRTLLRFSIYREKIDIVDVTNTIIFLQRVKENKNG